MRSPDAPTVVEFPVAEKGAGPYGLTTGPDGALWITLVHAGRIARFDPSAVQAGAAPGDALTTFPLDAPDCRPMLITPGTDGALWFTRSKDDRIGRITTEGAVDSYPLPTAGGGPYGITAADDGCLWFTLLNTDRIGRLHPESGEVTEFPLPTTGAYPTAICAGPDGALWCTLNQADALARVSLPSGPGSPDITVRPLPTKNAGPVGIASDGHAVWFVELLAGQVGRITMDGRIEEFPLLDDASKPHAIVSTGRGECWFTEWGAGRVTHLRANGGTTPYALPTPASEPHGIAVGSDGALWTAQEIGTLARITP